MNAWINRKDASLSAAPATPRDGKRKHETMTLVSFPKQDGRALRCLRGYISPRSAIRHLRVRGRGIHQNSLCSTRYTKEPLRVSDSVLCLWPSTLRPISSSPRRAWRELIKRSSPHTLHSLSALFHWDFHVHVMNKHCSYILKYNVSELFCFVPSD